MDPLTQGVLGAVAAQSLIGWRRGERVACGRWIVSKAILLGVVGAIAGMAADLDVLIQSASDPTLAWRFHRHFTHSLLFIPIGGTLVALPFLRLVRRRADWPMVFGASWIGYATHGPLDALTSYGTLLFWPLTDQRVALDWMPIVDPVYTLTLLVGVGIAVGRGSLRGVRLALLLSLLYFGWGAWQHHRASVGQLRLAARRGETPVRARVLPAPGPLLYWRSIYETDGRARIDGIALPWLPVTAEARFLPGGVVPLMTEEQLPAALRTHPDLGPQLATFHWFADGWWGVPSSTEGTPVARIVLGDLRYAAAVEETVPLWGVTVDPAAGAITRWSPPLPFRRSFLPLLRSALPGDPRFLLLDNLFPPDRL